MSKFMHMFEDGVDLEPTMWPYGKYCFFAMEKVLTTPANYTEDYC